MKESLKEPSFLSEIYNPNDNATSIQVRLLFFPAEPLTIEPDTSTTGKILSVLPSIKLGRAFHCSIAKSLTPCSKVLTTSYGYTAPAFTLVSPFFNDSKYTPKPVKSCLENALVYRAIAKDGTFEYSIFVHSLAHIFCSTVLERTTKVLRNDFGVRPITFLIELKITPFLGIHFAHSPFLASKPCTIVSIASSFTFVLNRTVRSSQRPNSGMNLIFFANTFGATSAKSWIISRNICLSPAPPRTSLAQNNIRNAVLGLSMKAFENRLNNLSLSCPLIAPMVKNRFTHSLRVDEFVTIPFSVKVSSVCNASKKFIIFCF